MQSHVLSFSPRVSGGRGRWACDVLGLCLCVCARCVCLGASRVTHACTMAFLKCKRCPLLLCKSNTCSSVAPIKAFERNQTKHMLESVAKRSETCHGNRSVTVLNLNNLLSGDKSPGRFEEVCIPSQSKHTLVFSK